MLVYSLCIITINNINYTRIIVISNLHSQVEEWTEQNISPLQEKTQKLLGLVERLKARRFWPRRPIP